MWAKMAEQGWLAIAIPEEQGGFGGSFLDMALILEQLGRGLVPEPVIASAVLGGGLLSELRQRRAARRLPGAHDRGADLARLRLCREAEPIQPERLSDEGREVRRRLDAVGREGLGAERARRRSDHRRRSDRRRAIRRFGALALHRRRRGGRAHPDPRAGHGRTAHGRSAIRRRHGRRRSAPRS